MFKVTNALKETLKKSESFCAYPYMHLSTTPTGEVRPCCFYTKRLRKDSAEPFNLAKDGISNVWNCTDLKELRRKLLSGQKDSGCIQCYKEERLGEESMRIRSFHELEKDHILKSIGESAQSNGSVSGQVEFLELKPGNQCNLKCRMCNKYDSSFFAKEATQIIESNFIKDGRFPHKLFDPPHFGENYKQKSFDWEAEPKFWEELVEISRGLNKISLAGGEPTMLTSVDRLFKALVQNGASEHIEVFLATNLTQFPQWLIETSQKFRKFEIIGSIDGTGKVQEYIRYPSKWEKVKGNFEQAKQLMDESDGVKALLNVTLQNYNILNFHEILWWLEELNQSGKEFYDFPFNLNILYFPRHLQQTIAPREARRIALDNLLKYRSRSDILRKQPGLSVRIDQIMRNLKEADNSSDYYRDQIRNFWEYTLVLDSIRKTSFEEALPELYAIFYNEMERLQLGGFVDNAREKLNAAQ